MVCEHCSCSTGFPCSGSLSALQWWVAVCMLFKAPADSAARRPPGLCLALHSVTHTSAVLLRQQYCSAASCNMCVRSVSPKPCRLRSGGLGIQQCGQLLLTGSGITSTGVLTMTEGASYCSKVVRDLPWFCSLIADLHAASPPADCW